MTPLSITWAAVAAALALPAAADTAAARQSIEAAHTNLWARFVGTEGVLRDYVGETPTPEDCREGRPNAIGWWSPIENGPMFTGLYLPAVCERAKRSGRSADAAEARRLADGLLLCASVSDVPGFIARGVGTDGRCHYPLGSEDQTFPWFYGLHAYLASGLPQEAERARIVAKMRDVADALQKADWRCPCDGAFKGQSRGDFKRGLVFRASAHYLFLLRAMADATGDTAWHARYRTACEERQDGTDTTRLAVCAQGYETDLKAFTVEPGGLWIYVGAQAALARLAARETDAHARAAFRQGLTRNAERARRFIGAYASYNNADPRPFTYNRWREGYRWEPQNTQADAGRVAASAKRDVLGSRKEYERAFVTTPLSAAAIVAFAGAEADRRTIEQALAHYDFSTIHLCEFFLAEVAYYALPSEETANGQR